MPKKDINQTMADEDQAAVDARTRGEAHQDAIAAEAKAQRVGAAKRSLGADGEKVLVTVTKFGEGKVSTGIHETPGGDVMAMRGDILEVSKDVADDLERRGFAEKDQ